MIIYISLLLKKKYAYLGDKGIYFCTNSIIDYGRLSSQNKIRLAQVTRLVWLKILIMFSQYQLFHLVVLRSLILTVLTSCVQNGIGSQLTGQLVVLFL
ncbi:MAG: hypothetical protein Q8877_02595, partial [Sweet potato little leaf phytoplasma]|nr:hypothetical protein [Sweet potato little leaf phytoplasma]